MQPSLTHVPCADEDRYLFDVVVETVHVFQLLDELAEVLALADVLEDAQLLLGASDLDVNPTVVHRTFHQLFDYELINNKLPALPAWPKHHFGCLVRREELGVEITSNCQPTCKR